MRTQGTRRLQLTPMHNLRYFSDVLRLHQSRVVAIFRLRLRTSQDSRSKSYEKSRYRCLYFLSTMNFTIRAICSDQNNVFFTFSFIPIFRSRRVNPYIQRFTTARSERAICSSVNLSFEVTIRSLISLLSSYFHAIRTNYQQRLNKCRRVAIVLFQSRDNQPARGRSSNGNHCSPRCRRHSGQILRRTTSSIIVCFLNFTRRLIRNFRCGRFQFFIHLRRRNTRNQHGHRQIRPTWSNNNDSYRNGLFMWLTKSATSRNHQSGSHRRCRRSTCSQTSGFARDFNRNFANNVFPHVRRPQQIFRRRSHVVRRSHSNRSRPRRNRHVSQRSWNQRSHRYSSRKSKSNSTKSSGNARVLRRRRSGRCSRNYHLRRDSRRFISKNVSCLYHIRYRVVSSTFQRITYRLFRFNPCPFNRFRQVKAKRLMGNCNNAQLSFRFKNSVMKEATWFSANSVFRTRCLTTLFHARSSIPRFFQDHRATFCHRYMLRQVINFNCQLPSMANQGLYILYQSHLRSRVQHRITSTRNIQVRPCARTMTSNSRSASKTSAQRAHRFIHRIRTNMITRMRPTMDKIAKT